MGSIGAQPRERRLITLAGPAMLGLEPIAGPAFQDVEVAHMDPLTVAPRWALCPLDWQTHALDTWADHPPGIWIARCGHHLSGNIPLYDVPQGHRCPACARWSPTTEPGTGQ